MLTERLSRLHGFIDPWRGFEELERRLDERVRTELRTHPPVAVWTNEDGAVVTFELPGVDPSSVDLSIQHGTLQLKAQRVRPELAEGEQLQVQERRHGELSRQVQLPMRVEASGITAHYRDGILEVRLPRAEDDKPRKITVQ